MSESALEIAMPNVGPGLDPLALADLATPVAPADPTTTEEADPAITASYHGRTIFDRPGIDALLARADRCS